MMIYIYMCVCVLKHNVVTTLEYKIYLYLHVLYTDAFNAFIQSYFDQFMHSLVNQTHDLANASAML